MLGRWVSELEPALVMDRQGRIVGLTVDADLLIDVPEPIYVRP